MLPHAYYKSHRLERETLPMKRHLAGTSETSPLEILLGATDWSHVVARKLSESLESVGLHARVHEVSIGELADAIRRRDYDMILVGLYATLPDPDGFLSFFWGKPGDSLAFPAPAGFSNSNNAIRFVADPAERLKRYETFVESFEDQAYVIPLFRMYFPVIVSKALEFPDTKYRFDICLNDVRWRSNVE